MPPSSMQNTMQPLFTWKDLYDLSEVTKAYRIEFKYSNTLISVNFGTVKIDFNDIFLHKSRGLFNGRNF